MKLCPYCNQRLPFFSRHVCPPAKTRKPDDTPAPIPLYPDTSYPPDFITQHYTDHGIPSLGIHPDSTFEAGGGSYGGAGASGDWSSSTDSGSSSDSGSSDSGGGSND